MSAESSQVAWAPSRKECTRISSERKAAGSVRRRLCESNAFFPLCFKAVSAMSYSFANQEGIGSFCLLDFLLLS